MESVWQTGPNPVQQRVAKGNYVESSGETGPEGKEGAPDTFFYDHWATDRWLMEAHLQFCYCAEGPEREAQHPKSTAHSPGDTEDACV